MSLFYTIAYPSFYSDGFEEHQISQRREHCSLEQRAHIVLSLLRVIELDDKRMIVQRFDGLDLGIWHDYSSRGANGIIGKSTSTMIQSFRNRKTERFFAGYRVSDFQGFAPQATRRLVILDSAESLHDLSVLRSNRLESLSGSRSGQYSIRINRQWRLCFRWQDDGPHDVEIVDYHL